MRRVNFVIFLCVCAQVRAMTLENGEETMPSLLTILYECGEKHHVPMSTVSSALGDGFLQRLDPCFLGCVFEKTELINEKGYVEPDAVLAKLKNVLPLSDYELAKTVITQCSEKVKEASPKDTCESARVLAPCLNDVYLNLVEDIVYDGVEFE